MRTTRTVTALLLVALGLAGCSIDEGSGDASDAIQVVIDTDVGSDDVMAILYLLSHPGVEVRAITVSGTGLAHCDPGVRTVLGLLEVAGTPDVPVACGRPTPLGGSNAFPADWRTAADAAYGLELPEPSRPADERGAVSVLAATIGDSASPVTLVTLGPLTNVADAFRAEPGLVGDIAEIVSMGGALLAGGNVEANPEAEWNFHADPRAVDIVLHSGAPVTLVPLDATNSVPTTPYFVDALAEHHVTPQAETVLTLLEGNPYLTEPGNYLWDPLAAVLAVDGSPATFEEQHVAVLEGSPDVDGELVLTSDGVEVLAAMTANPLAFEAEYLNTLNGDDTIVSTRPEPDLMIAFTSEGCTCEVPPSLPTGTIDVEVRNPLTVGGAAILATTKGRHTIDELVALVESIEATQDVEPPKWVVAEAGAEAPAGGSALSSWELGTGTHAVVCVVENDAVAIAGTIDVAG